MGNLPQNIHPLVRDGRSQDDRRLAALEPDTLKVDDRSLEQILEFVYEYARQVNYYDRELNKKDWLAFFRNSVPFQLARIMRMDLDELRKEYNTLAIVIQKELDFPALNPILDFLIGQASQVNFWKTKLKKDTSGLKEFVDNLIQTNLSSALRTLIKYANAANIWGYPSKSDFFSSLRGGWNLTPLDSVGIDTEFAALAAAHSADAKGSAEGASTAALPTLERRHKLAVAKGKLDVLFETFFEAMQLIQSEAKARLRASVDSHKVHEPHLGLFFAFLEVFGEARNDLNRMTKRHLDFYYKKVLRLKEKDAVMDKVHLVFELSPLEETYLLEKGMRFNAGEDAAEVDMHYELEDDIVVDSAQVERLQTIFLDQVPRERNDEQTDQEAAYQVRGIFKAPQANTADGQGEAFLDENNRSWKTVGAKVSKSVDEEKTTSRDNPQYKLHPTANFGVVLGSKALFLQEGQRTITLRLACDKLALEKRLDDFAHFETAVKTQFALTDQTRSKLAENGFEFDLIPQLLNQWKSGKERYTEEVVTPHAKHPYYLSHPQRELLVKYAERRNPFEVYLTVDGEWLAVSEVDFYVEPVSAEQFNLVLEMELDEIQPAIIAFDPEVHGLQLDLEVPAVKLELNHDFTPFVLGPIGKQGVSLYNYFRFLKVQEINFEVDVRNVRSLILQNSDGTFAADAPFQPFTADPKVGEQLYIGSQEVFQKDLVGLDLHLSWGGLPDNPFWLHYLGYRPLIESSGLSHDIANLQYVVGVVQKLQDTFAGQMTIQALDEFAGNLAKTLTDDEEGFKTALKEISASLEGRTEIPSSLQPWLLKIMDILAGASEVSGVKTLLGALRTDLVGQADPPNLPQILQELYDDHASSGISSKVLGFLSDLQQQVQSGAPVILAFLQELQRSLAVAIRSSIDELLTTQPQPGDFRWDIHLLKNRAWHNFTKNSRYELFDYQFRSNDQDFLLGKPFPEKSFKFILNPSTITGSEISEEIEELGVNTNAGFIRLSLKPEDFGHEEFPDLLSKHLTAQGLWGVEIGQAEKEEADEQNAVEKKKLEEARSDFQPITRMPDVLYLGFEEMVAILKLAALELSSWMIFVLEKLAPEAEEQRALIDARNAIGKDHPDYAGIKSLISALNTRVAEAAEKVDEFCDELILASTDAKPGRDPFTGTYKTSTFPNFLTTTLPKIQEPIDKILETNNELIAALEEHGKDPLHYVNLGITAATSIMALVENRALLHFEGIASLAKLFLQFYKLNEDGTTYDSSYNTHYIPIPREPYTPEITSLYFNYRAVANSSQVDFFHLHPFDGGYQQYQLKTAHSQPELLPPLTDEGTLYLGLNNLRPGSKLHLLFQMAESTADPFTEQATVNWSYLASNSWVPLENGFDVLSDETNGLIKSGIVEISIPKNINKDNTILSPELYWIKAAVPERAVAVSETIAVHTQAARVVFIDRKNDLQRLSKPLPKGSIAEAVETFDEIDAVNQFYDSFGGRPKEENITFYTRVSEQLRHKGRGITVFDFERLILENFPQIYKVKCITHTLGRMASATQDHHLAPGFVTVAVIPNLQNIQFANRFEPRATVALLKDIEKLIRKRVSPFVRLRVLNPDYEEVNFSGNIGFVEGIDEIFHIDKLKKAVQEFLAPWAFDPIAQIAFGGRIFRSTVLRFIEEQPYVDYVTDFNMFGADRMNVADIAATSARAILVPGKMSFESIECCYPSNT